MKKFLFLMIFIFTNLIFAENYSDYYYKGNEDKLISLYDSLNKSEAKISDTLIFYAAEISTDPGKSVMLYRKIVDKFTNSKFYILSQYRLAKYYIIIKDSTNAIDMLKRIIYAKDPIYTPFSYVAIIGYYERMGDQETAKKYINDFAKDFKNNKFLVNYSISENKHTKDLKNYFSIQIGAFSNKKNAEKTKNKYIDKGYDVYIINIKDVYKVRIGKFPSKTEAESFVKIFQKAEGINAWIVKED